MDLAELGLAVKSKPVEEATEVLDDFAESAEKAGDAAEDYSDSADKAGKASDKMSDEVDNAVKGFDLMAVGAAAAAAAITTGLVMGLGSAIGRIEEENKLLAQFEQALTNVGNTANTSGAQFKNFADQLEDSTGRAAEEILAIGSNLATFGFENDVFYDSIRLANDMAAAWGGDLRSSMEGLGRALDDPIAGFAMLSKRGISLTDTQAAVVQGLVDTNQKLEAQRYIIGILNEQVGGVAEAGFTGFAAAQTRLTKAVETFFEVIVEGTGLIDILSMGMNAAASAINFVSDNLGTLVAILAPVGVALGVAFGPAILASIAAITTAIAGPLLSAVGALTVALLANPFGLMVVGVTAAIAAIVTFREHLGLTDARLQAIGEVGSRVFNIIVSAVVQMYEAVAPVISAVYDRLVMWGSYIYDTLMPAFTALKDFVVPLFEEIWSWIDKILSAAEELLGIVPKVNNAKSSTEASSGAGAQMSKAIESSGAKAASAMNKGVSSGGTSAASSLTKASADGGKQYATALELANRKSSDNMQSAVGKGGDAAAAKIAAAGQVMAAKFEGTGRNIYDLWNNWGDAFIGNFGRTLGDMLAQFQSAQTQLLKAQAELARAQADKLKMETKYLERGKPLPGQGGGGGGTGGSTGGGTSTGGISGVDPFPWMRREDPAQKILDKYLNGGSSGSDTKLEDVLKDRYTLDRTASIENKKGEKTFVVKIINQVDPRDTLNTMTTRQGKDIINNTISQSEDLISAFSG